MSNQVKEFNDYRAKMNDKLLADNNLVIKKQIARTQPIKAYLRQALE